MLEKDIRPWGEYTVLSDNDKFKVKHITVQPGHRLSYQSHAKREEHWIVVSGSGTVTINDKDHPVKGGTHIHIPLQAKHRITNSGQDPLCFVEVQLGTYFGEDDIVRYQDDYKRV